MQLCISLKKTWPLLSLKWYTFYSDTALNNKYMNIWAFSISIRWSFSISKRWFFSISNRLYFSISNRWSFSISNRWSISPMRTGLMIWEQEEYKNIFLYMIVNKWFPRQTVKNTLKLNLFKTFTWKNCLIHFGIVKRYSKWNYYFEILFKTR